MDTVEIWVLGTAFTFMLAGFGFTHARIGQVRQEAIDIADRNKRDMNSVSDLNRMDVTNRMSEMREQQRTDRKEVREDLKDYQESTERFRQEIRDTLSEMKKEIMVAIRNAHPP
jgi:vacuolar-type H+-ATPase subunit I/STV1